MKYFTIQYWNGEILGTEIPLRYQEHVDSIRPLLTPSLTQFVDTVYLHDARLRDYHQADGLLRLTFTAYIYNRDWNSEGQDTLVLEYLGVSSVHMLTSEGVGLHRFGFGDLGYDELSVHGVASFEHHLLFSAGIEIAVRFRDLTFSRTAL